MSNDIPQDLLYTKTHEWIRREGDGSVTVGITDHAQSLLGDMVFVEVPAAGKRVDVGQDCAVVESVKAASDVYSPLSGQISTGNEALADSPELINQEPYGAGWLFRMKPAKAAELDGLLDAKAYAAVVAAEAH